MSWDQTAEAYSYFDSFTSRFAAIAAKILVRELTSDRSLKLQQEVVLADLACGTGAATVSLVKSLSLLRGYGYLPPIHLRASDVSEKMLDCLHKRLLALTDYLTLYCPKTLFEQQAHEKQQSLAKVPQSIRNCSFASKPETDVTFRVTSEVVDLMKMSAIGDQTLDGLTCVFGVMFPADSRQVARELYRVLKPGRIGVIVTWHYSGNIALVTRLAKHLKRSERPEADMAWLTQFGSEYFVRDLFGPLFGDRNIEVSFVSDTYDVSPVNFFRLVQHNPAFVAFQPWKEAECLSLIEEWTKTDANGGATKATMSMRGTAAITVVRKPGPLTTLSNL